MALSIGYRNMLKEAKSQRITTRDELRDIISDYYPDCTGGEFETAAKTLKLS